MIGPLRNPTEKTSLPSSCARGRSMSQGQHMSTSQAGSSIRAMELSSLLSNESMAAAADSPQKNIVFELLLDESSKIRARIPLRAVITPHDTVDSIIRSVENFYGIYDGQGMRFEDASGSVVTASYQALQNNSTVYIRITNSTSPSISSLPHPHPHPLAMADPHRKTSLGEPFQMLPPHMHEHSRSPSRPSSRLARKRSISPQYGRGRRSASQQKIGSFSGPGSRGSSANGSYRDDGLNGCSDSEGGRSSVTGSRKARSEQFASADISMDNVLQDGRRNKINFESSELPLFVPPQVPIITSTSSISPQRRSLPQQASNYLPQEQRFYPQHGQPALSPESYGYSGQISGSLAQNSSVQPNAPTVQHGHRLRDRSAARQTPEIVGRRNGQPTPAILPTPDPTIASCISDEDVARQLIALGDASNFSHGRTSASTVDDTFSGAADAASSTGATSDSEDYSEEDSRLPKHRRLNHDADDEYDHGHIKREFDEYRGTPITKKIKTKAFDGSATSYKSSKPVLNKSKGGKIRSNTLPKYSKASVTNGLMKISTAPATAGAPRKTSSTSTLNFQHQLGADEEDLSSKPRCQRCRKSKKGCDRQRPCQRCTDAGIGIEGCVSEDEGNGRKGRYGRHMGVTVKRGAGDSVLVDDEFEAAGAILTGMAGDQIGTDKGKKRKR